MSTRNTLAIAVLALVAGAAAGVLLAPASGKESRKKLKKKATGIKDSLGSYLLKGKETLEEMRGQAEEAAEAVHESANKVKEEAYTRHHQTSVPNA